MTWSGLRRVAVLLTGAILLAACGTASTSTHPNSSSPPPPAPLETTLTTADGTWAIVAMGHLDQPLNTFWQVFYQPSGTRRWALRTPTDVADNGGLVAATAGTRTIIGFRASGLLRYSPLAVTTDEGRSYAPGLVPAGLADTPDALSLAGGGRAAALAGEDVLASSNGGASWHTVSSTATLAASPAGRACKLQRLTAVVATGAGDLVGGACANRGVAAVLADPGTSARLTGPTLPAAQRGAVVTVVRLVADGDEIAALLAEKAGAATSYVAAWDRGGSWTLSPALAGAGKLLSTAVTGSGGFAVTYGPAGGRPLLASIAPGQGWRRLTSPPPGTAAVTVAGGTPEAIVVAASTMVSFTLAGGTWHRDASISVPIAYGSSG